MTFSLSYSRPGTETLQQISELWVKCKKSYWDSKLHPSCLTPLVLSIFNLPCQFWGVIIFERVISLCWNFQDHHISYIPLIWKGFIKIWDGSCLNFEILVPLTWNNPNAWRSSIRKCPSHASIENRHSKKYDDNDLEGKNMNHPGTVPLTSNINTYMNRYNTYTLQK